MRAITLDKTAPAQTNPLRLTDKPKPAPAAREVLVRIKTCGVCRTDLHLTEGDLPLKHPGIVPGHEIVGTIETLGPDAHRFRIGERVGVGWLRETCGRCTYCLRNRENLCPNARFTGWDHDGGYADYTVIREDFAYRLPDAIDDEHAAPLLCAGIIGFRAIERAAVAPGSTVGLYGFGASAHLAIQVLKHWKCRVFVMSRGGVHRDLAAELGADWIGDAYETPPAPLDSAILFAPTGDLVPPIMESLDRGGILAIAGIYLSPIPPLEYQRHLFFEKEIRSVTANTRADGEEFLRIAGQIPIRTFTVEMDLGQANQALTMLKHDELRGAAVLRIS